MPAIPPALGALITKGIADKMEALSGTSPLAQDNPAFFIQMCTAFGMGIGAGSIGIMVSTTDNGLTAAPPVPGIGTGVGIITDPTAQAKEFYEISRDNAIADFGDTAHDPFPPASGNSGEYLLAIGEGIAEAVEMHFATAFVLTTSHSLVYMGTGKIEKGGFSGLIPSAIQGLIMAAAPTLLGEAWAKTAEAVATSFVNTIHKNSTGEVQISGICIPLVPPAGLQICGVPGAGSGSGVAV